MLLFISLAIFLIRPLISSGQGPLSHPEVPESGPGTYGQDACFLLAVFLPDVAQSFTQFWFLMDQVN